MVSVNFPEADIANDEFIVKDYSENAGLLEALLAAGAIETTGLILDLPIGRCAVCRLTKP
jgi:hypothetical protein